MQVRKIAKDTLKDFPELIKNGYSEERNKKVSESKKGNKHFLGKTHSDEWKVEASIRVKEWYRNNENPNKGIKWTPEQCTRLSEIRCQQKNFFPFL